MARQTDWSLKGVSYGCCRQEGSCPLNFGRDLWGEPCTYLATREIKEGHIGGVDMKGIIIIDHADGCGPKYADFIKPKGIREGATYISDNATPEQRKVLKSFLTTHLAAVHVAKILGVKFVPINITHKDRTYHIAMPFGEQQFTLTVGGDGKTPIRMENGLGSAASNVKFANVEVWKYNDYGKNLEFYNTGGEISDFTMQGTL